MIKQIKLFAQMSGYMLIGTLSMFGLMTVLGTGDVGRASAANRQQEATKRLPSSVPSDMNYQGILRDGDGNVIESGEYDLTFNIYASSAAGEPLYTAEKSGVAVRGGRFSTTLSNIPATVFALDEDRFIGVTVGTFAEMVPRERLGSVPYAFQAENALNGVPVGGVVDWWRPDANVALPDGYMVCDGSEVTDPESPYFGDNTPDLRGLMVRGAGLSEGDELGIGGTATQTVDFGNGAFSVTTVDTTMAGGHSHTITGHTDGISPANTSPPDPGKGDYWIRNNEVVAGEGIWSNGASFQVWQSPASNQLGEGNHTHQIGNNISVSSSPNHKHSITLPDIEGSQTLDNTPPYINLVKICRIR